MTSIEVPANRAKLVKKLFEFSADTFLLNFDAAQKVILDISDGQVVNLNMTLNPDELGMVNEFNTNLFKVVETLRELTNIHKSEVISNLLNGILSEIDHKLNDEPLSQFVALPLLGYALERVDRKRVPFTELETLSLVKAETIEWFKNLNKSVDLLDGSGGESAMTFFLNRDSLNNLYI